MAGNPFEGKKATRPPFVGKSADVKEQKLGSSKGDDVADGTISASQCSHKQKRPPPLLSSVDANCPSLHFNNKKKKKTNI